MNFSIKNIGECRIPSPLLDRISDEGFNYISETNRIYYDIYTENQKPDKDQSFELAGPRKMIHFNPTEVRSAIVTCGGLCPGLNNVIRSIVLESYHIYGSKSILGFKYGYGGLKPDAVVKPIELSPENVRDIHKVGGTMLGSSRGGTEDMEKLVDTLEKMKINILYALGGDGTLKGAHTIAEIAMKRGLDLAVVGVPKTIDNDISYIQRSFGFESAFTKAVESISAAHVEAEGAQNGIGLVKLMGRHSGYIAAHATLAMNDVNFIFIPEVPFDMEGENGFLIHLQKRLKDRGHAVICVAEGAGQELLKKEGADVMKDASGNVMLDDIGIFMKNSISRYFKELGIEISMKYIDPSYIIRSTLANANDSIYCALLGQYAVHAAMAGKTDMVVGQWNNFFTHVPIELAISRRKKMDPNSRVWHNVLQATGQPFVMVNR